MVPISHTSCLYHLVRISTSPTLGPNFSQGPQSSYLCSHLSVPVPIFLISEPHLSGNNLLISLSPVPIHIWSREPDLPIPTSVSGSIFLALTSPNPGLYLTNPPHLHPQTPIFYWVPVVFPARKEIRRLGGATWTLNSRIVMAERLHEAEGSDGALDQGA